MADQLSGAIAINAVIAWRIDSMTLSGREVPNADLRLMFTDEETRVSVCDHLGQ